MLLSLKDLSVGSVLMLAVLVFAMCELFLHNHVYFCSDCIGVLVPRYARFVCSA